MKNIIILLMMSFLFGCTANQTKRKSTNAETQCNRGCASELRNLYYKGTSHFRDENYALAESSWSEILKIEATSSGDKSLQLDAYNNLGYLYFFDLGGIGDKNKAIEYWNIAIAGDHDESQYHLCHAYADKNQPTYNKKKAVVYCKTAYEIYTSRSSSSRILKQIVKYKQQLKN